jgi:hypothetical protein
MGSNQTNLISLLALASFIHGCERSKIDEVSAANGTINTVPAANDPQTLKSEADDDGLADAKRDIVAMKKLLSRKSPEELIASFIPTGSARFGGYEYYYNYMTNRAVRDELQSRGKDAEGSLRRHKDDKVRIWEAINGPGDTVGQICTELISSISKPDTRP